ncbi:MAG: hypothetical protein IT371_25550 [Deltaproteobacteria bacterium]|nr:hypothetical protein [Deltaproteobacteria bacterium]
MRARVAYVALAAALLSLGAAPGSSLSESKAGAPAGPPSELLVIVHPAVRVASLSAADLESIFSGSRRRWPDGGAIVAFNYPAGDGVRVLFDRVVLRLDPDAVARYWIDQRIRGMGRPPRQVPSAALLPRLIARLAGSVGYVAAAAAPPGTKLVARIRRGKVVAP